MSGLISHEKSSCLTTEELSHSAVVVGVGTVSRPIILRIHVKNVDSVLVESGCTWYTSTSFRGTTLPTIIISLLLVERFEFIRHSGGRNLDSDIRDILLCLYRLSR